MRLIEAGDIRKGRRSRPGIAYFAGEPMWLNNTETVSCVWQAIKCQFAYSKKEPFAPQKFAGSVNRSFVDCGARIHAYTLCVTTCFVIASSCIRELCVIAPLKVAHFACAWCARNNSKTALRISRLSRCQPQQGRQAGLVPWGICRVFTSALYWRCTWTTIPRPSLSWATLHHPQRHGMAYCSICIARSTTMVTAGVSSGLTPPRESLNWERPTLACALAYPSCIRITTAVSPPTWCPLI